MVCGAGPLLFGKLLIEPVNPLSEDIGTARLQNPAADVQLIDGADVHTGAHDKFLLIPVSFPRLFSSTEEPLSFVSVLFPP